MLYFLLAALERIIAVVTATRTLVKLMFILLALRLHQFARLLPVLMHAITAITRHPPHVIALSSGKFLLYILSVGYFLKTIHVRRSCSTSGTIQQTAPALLIALVLTTIWLSKLV